MGDLPLADLAVVVGLVALALAVALLLVERRTPTPVLVQELVSETVTPTRLTRLWLVLAAAVFTVGGLLLFWKADRIMGMLIAGLATAMGTLLLSGLLRIARSRGVRADRFPVYGGLTLSTGGAVVAVLSLGHPEVAMGVLLLTCACLAMLALFATFLETATG